MVNLRTRADAVTTALPTFSGPLRLSDKHALPAVGRQTYLSYGRAVCRTGLSARAARVPAAHRVGGGRNYAFAHRTQPHAPLPASLPAAGPARPCPMPAAARVCAFIVRAPVRTITPFLDAAYGFAGPLFTAFPPLHTATASSLPHAPGTTHTTTHHAPLHFAAGRAHRYLAPLYHQRLPGPRTPYPLLLPLRNFLRGSSKPLPSLPLLYNSNGVPFSGSVFLNIIKHWTTADGRVRWRRHLAPRLPHPPVTHAARPLWRWNALLDGLGADRPVPDARRWGGRPTGLQLPGGRTAAVGGRPRIGRDYACARLQRMCTPAHYRVQLTFTGLYLLACYVCCPRYLAQR